MLPHPSFKHNSFGVVMIPYMDFIIKLHLKIRCFKQKLSLNFTWFNLNFIRAGFWTIMTEQNIKYKVLIALLYHYMEKGQEMFKEERERDMCLLASGLYIVILGLPGSGAFKIFHPVLFSKALDSFTLVSKLKLNAANDTKKGGKKSSQSQSQSQSRKRRLSGNLMRNESKGL